MPKHYFPFDDAFDNVLPTERTEKIRKGRHVRPNKRRFVEKERRLAQRRKRRKAHRRNK